MKKAIYAFSGDPITFGHIDIVQRAANVFDEVIVAIGSNPDKTYAFSLNGRKKMAEKSLENIQNVRVVSFQGLLVDYAFEQNISVIVKGVRNTTDFDYENLLYQIGETQKLGIDTFVLFARQKLIHVSSGAVKAIQKEQGFIHDYVTLFVKQCLEMSLMGQYIVGVTGEIGSGKSYVTDSLVDLFYESKVPIYNIDLDVIGHEILGSLKDPKYKAVRKDLVSEFGDDIKGENGMINRKALGNIVFRHINALKKLNELMLNPVLVRIKRELYGKKGLIVLNGALLAEADMIKLCNNNVILIKCNKSVQENRLLDRGLKKAQIKRRLISQYPFERKKETISHRINEDGQGSLWVINNSGTSLKRQLSVI